MNLIFSGWPGAGTTTLALITAHLLGYKYLYAGEVFKYFAEKSVGKTSGPEYVQFEGEVGPSFDVIWDKYEIWKVNNSDKLLLESKLAGFFINSEKAFEIAIVAEEKVRISRATDDKRESPKDTLLQRDKTLQKRWEEEYGFNPYDKKELERHYHVIIDISETSISEEIEIIIDALRRSMKFEGYVWADLAAAAPEMEKLFWEKGKEHFRKDLKSRGQYMSPEEVIKEWKKHFSGELLGLPDEVKDLIYSN